jgi:sulfopyruvate decarboxylase alpha subunit
MPFDIPAPPAGEPTWPYELYKLLKDSGVTQFSYVPDAGHRVLIDLSLADPDVHSIPLTSEEEGVAMAAGAHLGGEKHVLLMQSSGAGNCINMLSLPQIGKFPFLAILSMRGDFGEGNPWQMPMGKWVQPVLEACDVRCLKVESPNDVIPSVEAGLTMAFQSQESVAVLLGQKLIGAKKFA